MALVLEHDLAPGHLRHSDGVCAVAVTPDGTAIVSLAGDMERVGLDPLVRLWDRHSGALQRSFAGLDKEGAALAVSRSGNLLAAADLSYTVVVWDRHSGEESWRTTGGFGLSSLLFADDDRILISIAEPVAAWSTADGRVLWTNDSAEFCGGTVLPDGSVVLVPIVGESLRVSATTGELLGTLDCDTEAYAVAAVPGSDCIVVGCEAPAQVWSVEDNAEVRTVGPEGGEVNAVAVSPDGALCAVAASHYADPTSASLTVVRLEDGISVATLPVRGRPVRSVAFTPDGQALISGDNDGSVKIFDLTTASAPTISGHPGGVVSLVWSADGTRLAACGWDGTGSITALPAGSSIRFRIDHTDVVVAAFTPDGTSLVVGTQGGSVALVDASTGDCRWLARAHSTKVLTGVVVEPCGTRAVTCAEDGGVTHWHLPSGSVLAHHDTPQRWCSLYQSSDGTLWLGTVGLLHAWSWPDAQPLRTVLHPASKRVFHIEPQPGGRSLAALAGSSVLHLDCDTGATQLRTVARGHLVGLLPRPLAMCTTAGTLHPLHAPHQQVDAPALQAWADAHPDDALLSMAVAPDGTRVAFGTCVGRMAVFRVR